MSADSVAILGFVALFALMLLRVPVGMAMGLVGVSGYAWLTGGAPALKLIELLRTAGAEVAYHDPHVPELPTHALSSQPLEPGGYDCVTIVTAHGSIDYERLVENAKLVVDFRNATGGSGRVDGKVWKL